MRQRCFAGVKPIAAASALTKTKLHTGNTDTAAAATPHHTVIGAGPIRAPSRALGKQEQAPESRHVPEASQSLSRTCPCANSD